MNGSFGEFIIFLFLVVGGPLALVFIIACAVESHQCRAFAEMTGHPTQYTAMTCYVKDGDRYMTMKQYNRTVEQNMNIKVKP